MSKELQIAILIAMIAAIFLSSSACVVTTKRDFILIMKANESVGYMRGLSECAEKLRKQ